MHTLGIGVLGSGWMAKAHTSALKALSTTPDLPFDIKLAALGGRSPERTEKAAKQWGFESYTTDWRRLVDNPQVHVKLPARQGWRFDNPVEGSAVYDLSHIIDLFRWIVDEPDAVTATVGSLRPVSENTGVSDAIIGADPEDSYTALVRTDGGLLATFRASRIATGRKGRQRLEITGEHGSLVWNMEDLNRLQVFIEDQDNTISGYRDVLVTEMDHPFMNYWFAPGHIIGWDHTVIHQWISVLAAITQFDPSIPTDFATFQDGARAVSVADSIRQSAREQRWIKVGASQSVRA